MRMASPYNNYFLHDLYHHIPNNYNQHNLSLYGWSLSPQQSLPAVFEM
jgi:hypothetical protein